MAREGTEAKPFLQRRAASAVAALPRGAERRQLTRVLEAHDASSVSEALVIWCGQLENDGRIREATEALDAALGRTPDDPTLLLHAARVARKADDRARARLLYDLLAHLDVGDGPLRRLAAVGQALVSGAPERELGRALRGARRADDHEAAAVALEARARVRRGQGDLTGAMRDYLLAAARFGDPLDIGRIGHELADLLLAAGDVAAARFVLVETESRARPRQSLWARARLLVLSRAVGDQVGMKRWAEAPPPPLTSLMPSASLSADESRLTTLVRWMDRLESIA